VQFSFAARDGVCGDGRSYVRLDPDSWFGTMNDYTRAQPCEAGPVRVVVVKSGVETIRLETYAGPPVATVDAIDLGRVPAGDAVAYLGVLATRGEGRVARDALLPLGIADSASVSGTFLALVRRRAITRGSSLGPGVDRATPHGGRRHADARVDRPRGRLRAKRRRAGQLSPIGHRDARASRARRGDPDPHRDEPRDERCVARAAGDRVLARHGDPRARRAVRDIASDDKAPVEVRAVAMSGLAGEYGSSEDARALMRLYSGLTSDRLRDAALSGIGNIGGHASRGFLLGIVKDEQHATRQRRKAASLLERSGVSVRDVISTYGGVSDGEVRVQLIELLAQAGTRDATAKLVEIAKGDTQPAARRRAIAVLGRSEDAAVREALRGLIGQ
jgi:hypothetical protein